MLRLFLLVLLVIRGQLVPASWARVVLLEPREQAFLMEYVLTWHFEYLLLLFNNVCNFGEAYTALFFRALELNERPLFQVFHGLL